MNLDYIDEHMESSKLASATLIKCKKLISLGFKFDKITNRKLLSIIIKYSNVLYSSILEMDKYVKVNRSINNAKSIMDKVMIVNQFLMDIYNGDFMADNFDDISEAAFDKFCNSLFEMDSVIIKNL